MNAAQSRKSRVVLPVPGMPTMSWCDRSRSYPIAASRPARWPTVLITDPTTIRSPRMVSGTEPGAAILALAERSWRRHCRWSKATPAAGDRPPTPARMDSVRYAQASAAAARPSGIAGGATVTTARASAPAAARCQNASQA
jgi:hypothetical protein